MTIIYCLHSAWTLLSEEMSALDSLKEFIEQRLAAAVEEIFEYFEKTVTKYEQELDRYREVLDMMLLPEIRLRREGWFHFTAVVLITV